MCSRLSPQSPPTIMLAAVIMSEIILLGVSSNKINTIQFVATNISVTPMGLKSLFLRNDTVTKCLEKTGSVF